MNFSLLRYQIVSLLMLLFVGAGSSLAQRAGYWQQAVDYTMAIDLDVETHRFTGSQTVAYTNNSPDTLNRIFYHLYFNTFQPGSIMDVRSRNLPDPDRRVRDRILHLSEEEIGYHKVEQLTQNGKTVSFEVEGTVLEADLPEPILPGETHTFEMSFNSQVPLQIRRSGRDNREGIDFSMTQWYPKVAEYDHEGWHTHPYVAREFIGVWGNFDVKITLDSSYTVGGTGILQNPEEIGHGYLKPGMNLDRPNSDVLTWHFKAENVHDFAWAADEKYTHDTCPGPNDVTVHLFYSKETASKHWDMLCKETARAIGFMNQNVGPYPYKQYSVLQGGDGGMEYPMATLITGNRSRGSLLGVTVHELVHSWFYGILGNNESLYPWMDEGFTSYWDSIVMRQLSGRGGNPHFGSYMSYLGIKYRGLEEPSITHADRFSTNYAYGVSSYSKGSVFLHQLSYVVGQKTFDRAMKRYFESWKFKHPTPRDFKRVVEKESGMELDWYFRYWLNTTDDIDYRLKSVVEGAGNQVTVNLERKGKATMPLDVVVTYKDGATENHYVPLALMRGEKPNEGYYDRTVTHPDWTWTYPKYHFTFEKQGEIESVEIDPSLRLADVYRLNNKKKYPIEYQRLKPLRTSWTSYNVSWRPALWYGEEAGVRVGWTSQGAYLFGQEAVDFDLFLTSGPVDDYGVRQTDVDYRLTYREKLDNWGLETYLNLNFRRYYGIFEEYLELEKQLGDFGVLSDTRQVLRFRAFHHARSAVRQIPSLNANWEPGDVYGLSFRYELGNYRDSGLLLNLTAATHRDVASASFSELLANKTYEPKPWMKTRFGFAVGLGAQDMPMQFQWNTSTPNPYNTWQNETFTSAANISSEATRNLHLLANGANGLIGYGLGEFAALDEFNNHYLTFTIWNTFQPLRKVPQFNLELFSGMGRSWSGVFVNDMPIVGDPSDDFVLASIGAGATYDLSRLRALRKWTAQSRFLQDFELSLRVPFFMHLADENLWEPQFVFGVAKNF